MIYHVTRTLPIVTLVNIDLLAAETLRFYVSIFGIIKFVNAHVPVYQTIHIMTYNNTTFIKHTKQNFAYYPPYNKLER